MAVFECLTPIEIERLLADSFPPSDKGRAEAHLGECEKWYAAAATPHEHGGMPKQAWSMPPIRSKENGISRLKEIQK